VRIISPHLDYSVQVFEGSERVEHDAVTGKAYTRTDKQPLVADFEQGGLYPHEVEEGLRVFEGAWGGLPEGINPSTRISVYDTEIMAYTKQWTPEFLEQVDERFRRLAVISPTRLLIVDDLHSAKPWPKYDDADAEEIVAYMGVLGIDPEVIRLYESENAARPDLLNALQGEINEQTEKVVTVNA